MDRAGQWTDRVFGAGRSAGRTALRWAGVGVDRLVATSPARTALVAGAVGLALAAGSVALAGPWEGGQRAAERRAAAGSRPSSAPQPSPTPQRRPAAAVLKAAGATGPAGAAGSAGAVAPVPTRTGLHAALAEAMADPVLGSVTASIADAATGRLLYGSGETVPATPASTTKIGTSIAALTLLGGDHRITTRAVRGEDADEVVLVGGGDPTLTVLPRAKGSDPDTAPASLRDLADRTAAALKAAGTTSIRLGYDTSAYDGPVRHPYHDGENIAPVSALMADEGRIDPRGTSVAVRYEDPADQAAEAFAQLLRGRGLTVTAVRPRTAPAQAAELARVQSPTLARLVERLLTDSDNDLAEAVARQVAVAAATPVSFEGAAAAVRETLARAGVPLGATVLHDGSGLSRDNAIPPAVLTELLALAASADHPELRPVLSGLPIAGFTGTLQDRYASGTGADAAAGLVRAKTGTLNGVNTLAGLVVDRDGRLLAFALMARGGADALTVRAALDRIAVRVAACGCR
ncbi:D-alanyl-D-alanine carboxypeptidase/D-alanyl-D-alanine endopeptidase [Peterkaempfera bronchialis]|uniref:D-alanyl-D-alanine carboxypeptidase/D-alanyl-D-alanine endopeptidase n=1 Tax=Peterkaempfera bronchialis TaxID=2126346 RepID=UPI001E60FCF0|nr:D-alanyl-D-alanine carboxypeptidase/D-alanyl-D-alanine-endopeptidase [Peterkaempfera bronchialis]